ncbi:hypothetical protein K4K58_000184 [Colletotrichum sp. SAR11_239]|nr:hypothetical protein K4K58_000184 [Colletotrichum sp. SAR11_239]
MADDDLEVCDDITDPHYQQPPPPMRSNIFSGGPGYLVSHPSLGGIVISTPSSIDLHHLNLPRTHDTKFTSFSQSEEDDLAQRILLLGGHWWPDWATYARHKERLANGTVYDFHMPPDVYVGYPSSGGVWVAKYVPDRDHFRHGQKFCLPQRPPEWNGVMHRVLTMDEKCEALKAFGATFYPRIEDCMDLPKSVEEGREEFQRYEKSLKDIDDGDYQRRWYLRFHGLDQDEDVESRTTEPRSKRGCVIF